MAWRPSAVSFYRALLLGYPAAFRQEYGGEMERLFLERMASEPSARVWWDALLDLALSAPVEHWHILRSDLRYGARVLAKSPGFAVIAVLTMALGIGASTAVFSLMNAVLIRSLPYGDPARLVYVWSPIPRLPEVPREIGPSWPDYVDWARTSQSFASLAAFEGGYFRVPGKTTATQIAATRVSGNFFGTLETAAAIGRTILPADDSPEAPRVAVISDALWRSRYGAAPAVLGDTVQLDRETYRIIGVMPPHFGYPHATDVPYPDTPEKQTDIWVPLRLTEVDKTDRNRAGGGTVIGRLKPGVDVRRAQAEMAAIEARLDPLHPPEIHGFTAYVQPMLDALLKPVRPLVLLLMGAVLMVLAICCANLANLLVARGAGRSHELGVRTAIGAGRARLVRQMLTEAALVAAAGDACGIAVGWAGMRLLARLAPASIPRVDEIGLHLPVLCFAVGISVAAGLFSGLLPALAASRVDVAAILAEGGGRSATRRSNRLRDAMIVAEVALAVTLLAGAGLLLRSFEKLAQTDLGFSRRALTMKVTLDDRYAKPEDQYEFYTRLVDRMRRIPGVAAAGGGNMLPLGLRESISFIEIEGRKLPKNSTADARAVTGGFCEAMGMHLLAGRFLTDPDGDRPPVVLISRRFRDVYFPGEDPLGKHIRFGGGPDVPWSTVVGVVEDVHHSNLEGAPRPTYYSLLWQQPDRQMFVAIGAKVPPASLIPTVQKAVRELDPAVALSDIHTMETAVEGAGATRRFQMAILTGFAALAVFLAAIGIYGLMAYAVRQRTVEIGIRMAVGASRASVIAMVLRRGMLLAAAGSALGILGAFGATRLIRSWLYGVTPTDAVTFAAVPLLLLAVAAAACLVPAWRAARVDPVRAVWGR